MFLAKKEMNNYKIYMLQPIQNHNKAVKTHIYYSQ